MLGCLFRRRTKGRGASEFGTPVTPIIEVRLYEKWGSQSRGARSNE